MSQASFSMLATSCAVEDRVMAASCLNFSASFFSCCADMLYRLVSKETYYSVKRDLPVGVGTLYCLESALSAQGLIGVFRTQV